MTLQLKPLAEQVILITGASSGIGLATARLAAARGAKVVLVSRDAETLARVTDAIVRDGGNATFAVADVGTLSDVQAAARHAVQRFGRIDTWVNDAGVAIYGKLIDTPMAEHERLFRTNYFGTVHGALTAVEHLQRGGGALITVASIVSDIPSPLMGAYAASKHAVKAYVGALRMEIEGDMLPISVTLIKPSSVATPVTEHAANHVDGAARVPPPVYDPDVVARAILDAAEHPRRDVTVGGLGRAQVLLAQHFPRVLDRLAPFFQTLMHDPTRPSQPGDNLARPSDNGEERSRNQTGRRTSLYTAARRHMPALMIAAGVAGAGAALGLMLNRDGEPSGRGR